ncbi:MAG: ComEC/Rec2 family competence protein [Bacteroidota bacterium]
MKRWPLNKAYFFESSPFFRVLLPFAAGIVTYYSGGLSQIASVYILIAVAVTLLAYFATVYIAKAYRFAFHTATVFLFVAGLSLSYFSDDRNSVDWYGKTLTAQSGYLVSIAAAPVEKETTWKIPVSMIACIDGKSSKTVTGSAFLYVYKDEGTVNFSKGDTLLVPGGWEVLRNAGNPFEFDYAAYCRRNNIFHRQYVALADVHLYGARSPGDMRLTEQAHIWVTAQLHKYITDAKARGLVQAMLLGDETNLDEEIRRSFTATGIIHIIAISGGNVSIFLLLITWLLWWLKNKRHRWVKHSIALPLVWFYILMAGAPPSAVRAAVMFTLLAVSLVLQKNRSSLNDLFATAFALLCAEPAWLYALGFQLSFVAVLSLILFYTPINKWIPRPKYWVPRKLWGTVAASLAAEILVAPLVIYYFHTFPLVFLVANVAAFIFMGLVLILSIAIICLSWVPMVATYIGIITTKLISWFDLFIRKLQQFNPPSFSTLVLSALELALVYIIITAVAHFLMRKKMPALIAALATCCVLCFSFCIAEWVHLHQQRLVVYNTRNGHTELIQGKTYNILSSDTSTRHTQYATLPAHIMWGTLQPATAPNDELVSINGKTALLLSNGFDSRKQMHIDYLMANTVTGLDANSIKKTFNPSMVVLAGRAKGILYDDFCRKCTAAGIKVHVVERDGASVME